MCDCVSKVTNRLCYDKQFSTDNWNMWWLCDSFNLYVYTFYWTLNSTVLSITYPCYLGYFYN